MNKFTKSLVSILLFFSVSMHGMLRRTVTTKSSSFGKNFIAPSAFNSQGYHTSMSNSMPHTYSMDTRKHVYGDDWRNRQQQDKEYYNQNFWKYGKRFAAFCLVCKTCKVAASYALYMKLEQEMQEKGSYMFRLKQVLIHQDWKEFDRMIEENLNSQRTALDNEIILNQIEEKESFKRKVKFISKSLQVELKILIMFLKTSYVIDTCKDLDTYDYIQLKFFIKMNSIMLGARASNWGNVWQLALHLPIAVKYQDLDAVIDLIKYYHHMQSDVSQSNYNNAHKYVLTKLAVDALLENRNQKLFTDKEIQIIKLLLNVGVDLNLLKDKQQFIELVNQTNCRWLQSKIEEKVTK
ncbi:MAG: hypothetical protein CL947_01265 [Epsilonproteobacteria bacterium]|nr:hypothetical protein [Campylobacterota bacterium]